MIYPWYTLPLLIYQESVDEIRAILIICGVMRALGYHGFKLGADTSWNGAQLHMVSQRKVLLSDKE